MHSIHASSYYLPSTVEKSNDFFLNGASVPQKRHMLLSLDAEQEAKRHVGKCNRCRTEARDSMHGRQGASTASRGALALAAGGNSSGGTQQASRECISAGGRGGFSGQRGSITLRPPRPGAGDQCCHLCPLPPGIPAKCKGVE